MNSIIFTTVIDTIPYLTTNHKDSIIDTTLTILSQSIPWGLIDLSH
jgi:hypothetical protein